jgi:hypothetical protein
MGQTNSGELPLMAVSGHSFRVYWPGLNDGYFPIEDIQKTRCGKAIPNVRFPPEGGHSGTIAVHGQLMTQGGRLIFWLMCRNRHLDNRVMALDLAVSSLVPEQMPATIIRDR